MKHLKKFQLFESKLSDFEEAKLLIQDWFDTSTEELIEIIPARIFYKEGETSCPKCGSEELLSDFDYDSGKTFHQCRNCDYLASPDDFKEAPGLRVIPGVYNEKMINCYFVTSKESRKKLLDYLSINNLENLSNYLKQIDYSAFRFQAPYHILPAWHTVIISKSDMNNLINDLEFEEQECFFPKNDINESRLIMSPEMREFINTHSSLWISRKLQDLEYDEEATDKINFLHPSGEDKLTFSQDKNFPNQDETTFDWKSQPHHNASSVGRVVRKILKDKKIEVSDRDIETFVNYWKAHFLSPDKIRIEIVEGEKIRYWYHKKNYNPISEKSPLGKSCMATECQPYLDIYVQNPEVCQMIIAVDNEDKLLGRALIWTDKKGDKLVDRIYYTNGSVEKIIINWVRQNMPKTLIYGEDFYQGGAPKKFIIKLKEWKFKKYPYLDSFNKLNWKTGELAAQDTGYTWSSKEPIVALWYTDGDFRLISGGFVHSEHLNDFLKKEEAYWDNGLRSYMPLKGFEKVKSKIKKWFEF